jgi:cytochrome P450
MSVDGARVVPTDKAVAANPDSAGDPPHPAPCSANATAMPPFDPKQQGGIAAWVGGFLLWLFTRKWLHWLLRTACPIARLGGWAAVTRYEDVAEILTRNDVFKVWFDKEIARLNDGEEPGTPFVLGIDNARQHDDQVKLVMQAFRRSDVDIVTRVSRDAARQIVKESNGHMDAIPNLITRVPLELCQEYYGVHIPGDRQKFAYATIAVSEYLFGPPSSGADASNQVNQGATYVRWVLDHEIDREIKSPSGGHTVLCQLVQMYQSNGLTRKDVRAFLMGMIIGFVPTNTIAGGHILEMLLKKPAFRAKARGAALAGDDDLLKHCLFEAMRFMPLNPGPFRICSHDYELGADTRRCKTIKKNTKVWASTMSAMFDCRQVKKPFVFNPGRAAADYMLFGYGLHWCAGIFIAQAQITQTFKALLERPGLERAPGRSGRLQLRGAFPDHLCIDFHP